MPRPKRARPRLACGVLFPLLALFLICFSNLLLLLLLALFLNCFSNLLLLLLLALFLICCSNLLQILLLALFLICCSNLLLILPATGPVSDLLFEPSVPFRLRDPTTRLGVPAVPFQCLTILALNFEDGSSGPWGPSQGSLGGWPAPRRLLE